MGQPPPVFTGDRTEADDFVDQVKVYLRLNHDVTGFRSPMKKMVFMLSHIQGAETSVWKREMGNLLDRLDPVADNIPALWDQFLLEFRTQYQDTQRENRAQTRIESHQMKFPDIDQYISSFEELARTAGYTWGDDATTHYFVRGLAPSVMIDVYKPPMPQTYEEIKQRAINSTRSRQLIDDILGKRRGTGRGQPPRPNFFSRPMGQSCPFFSQQQSSLQQQRPPPPPQYNTTNAP
jgi:Retrotransposon gag protein